MHNSWKIKKYDRKVRHQSTQTWARVGEEAPSFIPTTRTVNGKSLTTWICNIADYYAAGSAEWARHVCIHTHNEFYYMVHLTVLAPSLLIARVRTINKPVLTWEICSAAAACAKGQGRPMQCVSSLWSQRLIVKRRRTKNNVRKREGDFLTLIQSDP